jgi:hypothetical protein
MRITSFECVSPALPAEPGVSQPCNPAKGSYKLLFSHPSDSSVTALTQANIQAWKTDRIPTLTNGQSAFVVETSVQFQTQIKTAIAGMMVGVTDNTFGTFIVTRPRHGRLCLEGTTTCT